MTTQSFFRVAFVAALFTLTAFAFASANDRPNILWINAEDMSPHLGCYGHPDAVTPHIDGLASEGIVYRNAFATAPICSPARSCLATGLYATSLGTQHLRCEVRIPQRVVPLATRLRKLGYFCTNTGKSDYNFDPNGIWDAWNSKPAPWRERRDGQPFFAFITVGETHEGRINFVDRYQQATADLPDELKHDPAAVSIPPFYPDTPEIRGIFARMYDLATVFDHKVGQVIEQLKQDGDFDNTIIFIFGDHGNGLPRYKRWLNDSGLRVPLVVRVPPKFRQLSPVAGLSEPATGQGSASQRPTTGITTDRLVSFVDFPATALSLAGVDIPPILQGEPFLGKTIAEPRQFVFGARSRADDMFEVSRSVFDGRFLYVRHFMPHLPYIQPGVIFDDRKDSFRELRKLHQAGQLNEHAARLWVKRKPVEELYDLQSDPHELNNLSASAEHEERKHALAKELQRWILEHRDSGFLPEAEYQIRASEAGLTPFDVVQDPKRFDLNATLSAAWRVGQSSITVEAILADLRHEEAGVRYWSAVALQAAASPDVAGRSEPGIPPPNRPATVAALLATLSDTSPSVRIAAAEALLAVDDKSTDSTGKSLATLAECVQDDRPWVALQAARAIALTGSKAKPIVPAMKAVIDRNRSKPGSKRPYKDFNYASFTGWALEAALLACGEGEYVEVINN